MSNLEHVLIGAAVAIIATLLGFIGVGYGARIGSLEDTRRTHGERLAKLETGIEENRNSLDRIDRNVGRLVRWQLQRTRGGEGDE